MATYKVRKRNDLKIPSWQYDVRDGSLPSGKKRLSGFNTKKEAQHAAQTLIRQIDDGYLLQKDITFKEYYQKWIEANGKYELSKGQFYWYERSLDLFIEHFGENCLLKKVYKQDYQLFLNNYGKGRTTETVRKVHGCITQVIKDAVYDEHIKKDPTYKVVARGTKAPKREEDKYIKVQEYLDLIQHFKSKSAQSYIFLEILALTGARFSEVNQMTWNDLNKAPGIIHLPGTKSDSAPRDVELSVKDIEHIRQRLNQHPRRIDGRLFKLSHNAIKKALNYAKTAINMPDDDNTTTYALRHTHCSYLISEGIPIEYISKRLGHSSISITLNFYAHLLDEYREKEGEKVRELFS